MSKFVDEIIRSIKTQPEVWSPRVYVGSIMQFQSHNIYMVSYGNGPMMSILHVETNKGEMQTTWLDRYRLEKAISWWFQNVSLELIVR